MPDSTIHSGKVAISEVGDDIYHISTYVNSVAQPIVAYLVAGQPAALIEPGPSIATIAIWEALQQLGPVREHIAYIAPTHIHVEHGGGAGYLARQLPQAKVLVHPRGTPHLIDPQQLIAGTKLSFGDDFERNLGPIVPVPSNQLQPASDGELLSLGDRELRVIHTPGHAPHHMSYYDSKSRGIFCGEALGVRLQESDFLLPSATLPSFDVAAALESIEKLEKLAGSVLFFSHDGVVREVLKFMSLARESIENCAQIIEEAMKKGESMDGMSTQLRLYAFDRGIDRPKEDFHQLVEGYTAYFGKKSGSSSANWRAK